GSTASGSPGVTGMAGYMVSVSAGGSGHNHVTLRAAIRSRYQLFISTWAVSLPMMSASSVSVPMAARYTPTRNGMPLPIPHSHPATNGATAAPRMDETL